MHSKFGLFQMSSLSLCAALSKVIFVVYYNLWTAPKEEWVYLNQNIQPCFWENKVFWWWSSLCQSFTYRISNWMDDHWSRHKISKILLLSKYIIETDGFADCPILSAKQKTTWEMHTLSKYNEDEEVETAILSRQNVQARWTALAGSSANIPLWNVSGSGF